MNFNHQTNDISAASGSVSINGTVPQAQTTGTYSPTLTPGLNTTSVSSSQPWMYTRIGNMVFFSGVVSFSASAASQCDFTATLPVASTFTNSMEGVGHITSGDSNASGRVISQVTVNNLGCRIWVAATGSQLIYITGQYKVI